MAQDINPVSPFDSSPARKAREPLAQGEAETAGIKREIEKTRVEMGETLGEIQERLRPEHLIQQAKDTVTDAATGKVRSIMNSAGETATMVADETRYAGRSVADYVRTHPVQMAILAGGVTWWLLRGRDRSDDWAGASEGWQDHDGGYYDDESRSLGARVSSAREAVGDYASAAKDTVSSYAASARQAVGDAAESARYAAQDVSGRVGSAARSASLRARDGWQRASTSVDDWVDEYPVAAGLLALAVGTAIGLSVPGTELEDRAMGERRDQALDRARSAAREITDNVTNKVASAAESVLEVTGRATPPAEGRA